MQSNCIQKQTFLVDDKRKRYSQEERSIEEIIDSGDTKYFDPSVFQGGKPNLTTTSTTTPPKSTSGNVSWLNQGLELLQTGFQGYLQLDENKTKRELADASVKISTDDLTKETLKPPSTGLSTGAIVGISLLGVTVVGLVIYLITKNKNQ